LKGKRDNRVVLKQRYY